MEHAADHEPPFLIGLDVGTHSVRALAFDRRGRPAAVAAVPTPTLVLPQGRAEYEPEALWQAVLQTLATAVAALPKGAEVAGLAVASVGETCIPLDRDGQPVANAIAWFDRRTEDEAERLARTIGEERLFQITGLPIIPIYTLCKLLWMRRHQADAFGRAVKVLAVADWIAYRLSGVMATDYSLASRTLALDLKERCWSAALLDEVGLSPALFAPLTASGTALGPVLPDVATATGLSRTAQVGVGGHDHLCGSLAAGGHLPGTLLDSLGTAEALFLTTQRPILVPEVLRQGYFQGAIEVADAYAYLGGGIYSSGGAIEWFRTTLAVGADHAALIAEAEASGPGAEGALFLPHLAYSAPPQPDTLARGAFLGLTAGTGRGALFRAVLEGLALEARLVVDGMASLPGLAQPREIRAIGGSTKNPLFLRIKASAYGRPIIVIDQPEATALGAALLGGLAGGAYRSLDEALATIDQATRTVEPEADWTDRYATLFERVYRLGYPSLRPINQAIDDFERRRHREPVL